MCHKRTSCICPWSASPGASCLLNQQHCGTHSQVDKPLRASEYFGCVLRLHSVFLEHTCSSRATTHLRLCYAQCTRPQREHLKHLRRCWSSSRAAKQACASSLLTARSGMKVLTLERTLRLHPFCAQWESTCSSSRAPLPERVHRLLSQRSGSESAAGCAGSRAGSSWRWRLCTTTWTCALTWRR